MLGLESACERVRRLIEKGNISVKEIKQILELLNNYNISVRLSVMIGFPTETKAELIETINFLLNNKELIDKDFSAISLNKFDLFEHSKIIDNPELFSIIKIKKDREELGHRYFYETKEGLGMHGAFLGFNQLVYVIKNNFKRMFEFPATSKCWNFIYKCYPDLYKKLKQKRFKDKDLIKFSLNFDYQQILDNTFNYNSESEKTKLQKLLTYKDANKLINKESFIIHKNPQNYLFNKQYNKIFAIKEKNNNQNLFISLNS